MIRDILDKVKDFCAVLVIMALFWCVLISAASLKKLSEEARRQNDLTLCFNALQLGIDTKVCDRLVEKKA